MGADQQQTALSDIREQRYAATLATARVAGAVSAAVLVLLVWNSLRLQRADPLESPQLKSLKQQLIEHPKDDSLKRKIRQVDQRLRREFFWRRQLTVNGRYLLLVAALVLVFSLKSAADQRRELPMPHLDDADATAEMEAGRRAVWIALAVFCLAAVALGVVRQRGVLEALSSSRTGGYATLEAMSRQWPMFRGPGAGAAAAPTPPQIGGGSSSARVLWKTRVPLPGLNSPVAWGERVFLSGATAEKREVYGFDLKSGDLLWRGTVDGVPGSPEQPVEVMEDTGFAAPTCVTDGHRVFAVFANGDVAAFTADGERLWAVNLGAPQNNYGHATSLAIYRNLVLVVLDQGAEEDNASKVYALDAATGVPQWEQERPVCEAWSSPIVVSAAGKPQFIVAGNPWVIAYAPDTGEELWRARCLSGDLAPSPAFADPYVLVAEPYARLLALRTDGAGDVTDSSIAWEFDQGSIPGICSPAANSELAYLVDGSGMLTCVDVKQGQMVFEQDLGVEFKASPVLVGPQLWLVSAEGEVIVVRAARQYQEVGRMKLNEAVEATPAFIGERVLIRGKQHLFCIGE